MNNYRKFISASKSSEEDLVISTAKTILNIETSVTIRYLSSSHDVDDPQKHAEAHVNSMFRSDKIDKGRMIKTLNLVLLFKDSVNNCTRACLEYLAAVVEFLRETTASYNSSVEFWNSTTIPLVKFLGRSGVIILKTHDRLLCEKEIDIQQKWKIMMSTTAFNIIEEIMHKKSSHFSLELF